MTHGIWTTTELRAGGLGDRAIARKVASGDLRRVRRGVYTTAAAHPDVTSAAIVGGGVTCVTALRHLGVWTMPDTRLHVAVHRGGIVHRRSQLVLHWTDARAGPIAEPADALACAISCVPMREAIVAMDSIVNRRILRHEEVAAIAERSANGRHALERWNPASESGIETLARLALRSRRVQVRCQVSIAGGGRVDLLIGDRLVLELDGEAWHDRPGDFERDRARDRALVAAGYVVMRMSYHQVMHGWPEAEEQILQLVRRREHLWRSSHRALGHSVRAYRG